MAPNFSGKYALAGGEKFDEYLRLCETPEDLIKKTLDDSKLTLDVEHNGDTIHMKSTYPGSDKVREDIITVGVPKDETLMGGSVIELNASWEGDSLRVDTKTKSGPAPTQLLYWGMEGDDFVLTCIINDVTARRVYKKI